MNYPENLLKKPRSLRTRFVLVIVVLYWAIIFTGTHTPTLPRGMPRISDKLLHMAAFLGLAFLLSWPLRRLLKTPWRAGLCTFGCCFVYGIFDELTQLFVRNRRADVRDFLADCCGALLGIGLFMLIRRIAMPDERTAKDAAVVPLPEREFLGRAKLREKKIAG